MSNLSQGEIFKYDYLYEKYPERYGQINADEPRFDMAYKYLQALTGVKTILDAGVGRGGFYELIREQYDVYGIEPSKVAIEQFHRGDERIKPMYIQELPQHFEHDTFDAVVCLDVLEHIPQDDIDSVFSALAQVGRKYFIFSIAHHSDVWDEMELHVANIPYAQWEEKLAHHFHSLVKLPIHGGLSWVYLLEKKELLNSSTTLQFDRSRSTLPPFISVIVPTYNQAQYLGEALDSLRGQTYEYWEAVIVNDGSTDNTKEVIAKYEQLDLRFRHFHKKNGGVASALNEGVRNSKGEWICWLSSDDLFERDKLEVHKNAIEANPEIKFFHSHFYYLVEETNTKTEPGLWFPLPEDEYQVSRFFLGNYVHGNAVAIHRTVFDEVGLFDETLRQAQDFDMWLRVSAKFRSHFINKRTCVTRLHKGQTTNSFPEGCYFDSAWACAKFFDSHRFEEIFPLLDLRKELDARKALLEVVTLSATEGSFMNYGGFMPAFLDRANEWLVGESPKHLRQKLLDFVAYAVNANNFSRAQEKVLGAIRKLGKNKQFRFRLLDFSGLLAESAKDLIAQGKQKQALTLERYATQIANRYSAEELADLQHKPFVPSLFGFPVENKFVPLNNDHILTWFIEPITNQGLFRHTLKIQCLDCSHTFNFVTELFAEEKAQEVQCICPECKNGYFFSDGQIDQHLAKSRAAVTEKPSAKVQQPRVVFLARGIHGKSGGTMVFAKHIQWLGELGCDIIVYSDSQKPLWINLPGKFIKVKDFREVDPGDVDLVVLYCMFELPLILKKIDPSKIVYICQAYEGYLYGRNYSELRADKAFFNSLHSLPFNVVTVSRHLTDLFEKKFNKIPYYIPNSVNHSIFKLDPVVAKESPSILFVGNPFHPLKGFDFLGTTINSIQRSQFQVNNLKLIVATGISSFSDEHSAEELQRVMDCEVVFKRGLSSKEVAALMNAVDMVVCPSWYEGFSLILLEAMACGTPVITTNNMGAESFCVHDHNSFVVEYGNAERLGNIMLSILAGHASLDRIKANGLRTSLEYSDLNSFDHFVNAYSKLLNTEFDGSAVKKISDGLAKAVAVTPIEQLAKSDTVIPQKKLSITYLVTSILGITGGNQTLLKQANALVERGHQVTIITHSEKPRWFNIKARVCKAPDGQPLASYAPQSDVAISTYFTNTAELKHINATVKMYFAQGDQFIFEDEPVRLKPELESIRSHLQELSNAAYSDSTIRLVANSKALAEKIDQKHKRKTDAILNVGIDEKIFRPLQKAYGDSRPRILVVGPDILGTELEPLTFKGMLDIRKALERLSKKTKNFTLVRMSNSEPSVFKDFPCEFYIAPNDELKTFLYGTAHILVYASHYESWGLPPLEAMASGTAVVCTATPAAMEYCRDGENCLLVPPKSPEAIYQAIDTLLTDTELRNRIVAGGLETARLYSKKREWDELEHLLYKFIENTSIPARFLTLLRKAYGLMKKKQFEAALSAIGESQAEYEKTSVSDVSFEEDLFNLRGVCYLSLNDLVNAQCAFEETLKINPNSSEACVGLGNVFYLAEMDNESKMMFEWAVKNDPNNQAAQKGLTKINTQLGLAPLHSSLDDKSNSEEPVAAEVSV